MPLPAASAVIVETPRDAFQGLGKIIPTPEKVRYIKALLDAGLAHVDLGSFVSPKAVPQMADTREVIDALRAHKGFERIALVANEQGVERAIGCGGLDTLGYPFSFSDEFQKRNTRKTIAESWPLCERLAAQIQDADMGFLVYVSMAFGNPYKEAWDEARLLEFCGGLHRFGVRHIALSDTVAVANPAQVGRVFKAACAAYPDVEFSVHLHGRPQDWQGNIEAALDAGCRRFDAAAGGMGGCPFAQDKLVANIPSEGLAALLARRGLATGIDQGKLDACARLAQEFQARYS